MEKLARRIGIVVVVLTLILIAIALYTPKNSNEENIKSAIVSIENKIKNLDSEGYDTTLAKYYLISAKVSIKLKKFNLAKEYLHKVTELIKKPDKIPEVLDTNLTVVDFVSIRKIPSTWDEVPINRVFVLSKRGYIVYPSNIPFKLSCFILILVAWTKDGKLFSYQGRLPMLPGEGKFSPRFWIKNSWIIFKPCRFVGPIFYKKVDENSLILWQSSVLGICNQSLIYHYNNRTYIHEILYKGKTIFHFEGRARGIPMWLGDWNTWITHGVYGNTEDFDTWSGYWDFVFGQGYFQYGELRYEFEGVLTFDRATHISYNRNHPRSLKGAPCCFSDMVIWDKENNLLIAMIHSDNPTHARPPRKMEHKLIINIYNHNNSNSFLETNNFTFSSKGIPIETMNIEGKFRASNCSVSISLSGKSKGYYPPKWVSYRVWWGDNSYGHWGRAMSEWTGRIEGCGLNISVKGIGFGEYTRTSSFPLDSSCEEDSCWNIK